MSVDLNAILAMKTVPIEENLLQLYLNDLQKFAIDNGMKINHTKSKSMKFSRSDRNVTLDFKISSNKFIEDVNEIKLLGIMLSDDLKWEANTDYICKKARNKNFLLRNI